MVTAEAEAVVKSPGIITGIELTGNVHPAC
jgi:hypothetical protein